MSSSGLKKFCARFYHQTFFWGESNIDYEKNCAHLNMKGSFHLATQFGSWFLKKKSQGACFFTVVHACTRSLNEACRKCGVVAFIGEHRYIHTEEGRGVAKHSWKKIMQLLWTVLKNVKHGIEHGIDSI